MLPITRRVSESLIINSEITVTVLAIRHDRVRLGLGAPWATTIVRSELIHDSGDCIAANHHTENAVDVRQIIACLEQTIEQQNLIIQQQRERIETIEVQVLGQSRDE